MSVFNNSGSTYNDLLREKLIRQQDMKMVQISNIFK